MCNFQIVFLVDFKYKVLIVCVGINFYSAFTFIDDGVVDSDLENNFWSFIGLFLSSIEHRRFWISWIAVVSDSETAFRVLEKFNSIISFFLVIIAFCLVCFFFDLIYPIFVYVV